MRSKQSDLGYAKKEQKQVMVNRLVSRVTKIRA